MRKTRIVKGNIPVLVIAFSAAIIFVIGIHNSLITAAARAMQQAQAGCAVCHAKLSAKVPQSHFKPTLEEVKYCLVCHSRAGSAAAFDWVIHFGHYSKPGFAGDCWACHQIDKTGSFQLIGSEVATATKVAKAKADQMGKYFRSWATSEYKQSDGKMKLGLDRKHALQGVTCELCHGTLFPEERASMEQCFRCHGSYKHLAALSTAKKVNPNPHYSHEGEVPCNRCHHDHEQSELYCNECHSFDLKVP